MYLALGFWSNATKRRRRKKHLPQERGVVVLDVRRLLHELPAGVRVRGLLRVRRARLVLAQIFAISKVNMQNISNVSKYEVWPNHDENLAISCVFRCETFMRILRF